ncbi:MAG: ATP-binding protein [Spirochaetota bacterium]
MSELDMDALLAALQLGETQDWEFKSAKGGFPGSFWETYSAMANTEGGTIVLGVVEREGRAYVDGLADASIAKYQKVIRDGANNRTIVNRDILSLSDVAVASVGVARLLVVHVPRAERTIRPVHVGQTPFGSTYKRADEGDYRCSDAEVRRMLADADPLPADHRILVGFSLDDLDSTSLAQYRQRLRSAKGEHAWLSLGRRTFSSSTSAPCPRCPRGFPFLSPSKAWSDVM